MKLSYTGRRILGVLGVVFDLLLVVILLVSLYNIISRKLFDEPMPKIGGFGYAVVVSGSMEPEISISDVVYVKEKAEYVEGDIITFVDADSPSKSLVTHRIVEVKPEGYVTKGDANNAKDEGLVELKNVKGAVIKTIPYFGASLLWVQKPVGMLCMILLALLFIELPYRARTTYKKATDEKIEKFKNKFTPKEEKKFTPDLYWEENDGSYKAPEKTRAQIDFEKEVDWRRRHKQKKRIYVPDEKHWSIDE